MRDEDFRTVLVVAGAQGSRGVLARDQAESESVAGGFVFRGVILKVFPKMVGQRVFVRDIGFKNGFELRPFCREFREFKRAPFLEADKKDAFAVLRHDALRVYDFRLDVVAERVGERVVDDLKRPALVVALEVLHVLQHKRGGLVELDDFREGKEQIALFLVVKAVRLAEAQLFGDARDAERLAGKPGAQDVVLGYIRHGYGMDVAERRLAKICGVGLLRVFVPVGRKDAFASGALKRKAEPADAAKQINKAKFAVRAIGVDVIRR